MQELNLRTQLENQEVQGQNAIRQLYTNPSNFDPRTGRPTANAIHSLMVVSPEAGLNYLNQIQQQQRNQNLLTQEAQQAHEAVRKQWLKEGATPAVAEYESTLKAHGNSELAQQAMQKVWSQSRDDFISSGRIPGPNPETVISPRADYMRAKSNILGLKGLEAQEKSQAQETRAASKEKREEEEHTWKRGEALGKEWGDPVNVTITGPDGKSKPVVAREYKPSGEFYQPGETQPVTVTKVLGKTAREGAVSGEDIQVLGDTTEVGQNYVATLPIGERSALQLMLKGGTLPVGGWALRSSEMRRLLAEAEIADPGFDQQTYNRRRETIRSYSGGGKDAQNIQSFNMAIDHASKLWDSAQDLHNFGGALTPLNPIKRVMQTAGGDPRYRVFNENVQALSEELTRAFRGTGGNVDDIKNWKEAFNSAGSPEQIRASIQKAMDLLQGRIAVKREDYDRAMGEFGDFSQFLYPQTVKNLQRVPGGSGILDQWKEVAPDRSASPGQGSGGPPPSPDRQGTLPPAARAQLREGQVHKFNNGQSWTLQNGQPVRLQ